MAHKIHLAVSEGEGELKLVPATGRQRMLLHAFHWDREALKGGFGPITCVVLEQGKDGVPVPITTLTLALPMQEAIEYVVHWLRRKQHDKARGA